MQHKTKERAIAITAFLAFSIILAFVPKADAVGAITLTPNAQAPGASVSVSGTGFGATKAVGIGFGGEVAVTNEVVNRTVSGTGPYVSVGHLAFKPVEPGTFNYTVYVPSLSFSYDVYDNGDGTLASTNPVFMGSTADYVTGEYTATSTSAAEVIVYATYTHYQYGVTPADGATTNASGSFTASFTVPPVANGNYIVTAIDTQGNRVTATLNVNSAIPEVLPVGLMVLLSSVAVIASSRYFRQRKPLLIEE